MITNLPSDMKAETLANYLSHKHLRIEFKGTHKRNAYEDILSITEADGEHVIEVSRDSLYDILPEALFHPIDRFDNISANEYKDRFAEECELQQTEESNARKFFAVFDKFIFDLSCELNRIKDEYYSDNAALCTIICDTIPDNYLKNRFVKKLMPFIPLCNKIRGDKDMITIIIRKILNDEDIELKMHLNPKLHTDADPLYNASLNNDIDDSGSYYLGNQYYETVSEYEVVYWNDDECNESFLSFISEMQTFENFVNDFFVGIESSIKFKIETIDLPTRLSDKSSYNYLGYNTNL